MISSTGLRSVVACLCVATLSGCWPTFPDELLKDSGAIDAGMDTGRMMDAAPEADTGPPVIRGGWRVCPAGLPGQAQFPVRFATGPSATADIALRAQSLVAVGNGFLRFDSMGAAMNPPDPDGGMPVLGVQGSRAARFRDATTLVVAQDFDTGMGVQSGLLFFNDSFQATMVPSTQSSIRGLAIGPGGTMYYSDTATRRIYSRAMLTGASEILYTFANAQPESLAVSPDGLFLYVASSTARAVFEIPLTYEGRLAGTPTAYVADISQPHGMAFDACGNLYIALDSRIVRVHATTRLVQDIVPLTQTDSDGGVTSIAPRALAFGQSALFGRSMLYVVDANTNGIFRTNVGLEGQTLP